MKSLIDLAQDIFKMGVSLKDRDDADAQNLQKDLIKIIKSFTSEAASAGYTQAMVEESKYAVMAWLDEMIFMEDRYSIDWFSYSLVVAEFEDSAAGIGFFTRLDKLHQLNDRVEVLKLYGYCLLLGFRGKYRLEGEQQVKDLIKDIFSKKKKNEKVPFVETQHKASHLPSKGGARFWLWGSVALTVLAVGVYFALLSQVGA